MKRRLVNVLLCVTLVAAMAAGCGSSGSDSTSSGDSTSGNDTSGNTTAETSDAETGTASDGKTYRIGFSQGTMNHPYRIAMVEDNVNYAKEHYPEFEIITTDGQNNSATQMQNVEDLLASDIDLLLISPLTSDALTDVCQKAMDMGIPVVTLDRNVECEVTCYVGAENRPMGVASGEEFAKMLDGKGNIIEVLGTAGASADIDRQSGFEEALEAYPDMNIIASQYCDYLREDAMQFMEDMLQRFGEGEIDGVFCTNDEMAMGVLEAIKSAGREDEGILVSGMDGTEIAFEAVQNGEMAFTVVYPTCAPEGVEAAYDILEGDGIESCWELDATLVNNDNVSEWVGKGLE